MHRLLAEFQLILTFRHDSQFSSAYSEESHTTDDMMLRHLDSRQDHGSNCESVQSPQIGCSPSVCRTDQDSQNRIQVHCPTLFLLDHRNPIKRDSLLHRRPPPNLQTTVCPCQVSPKTQTSTVLANTPTASVCRPTTTPAHQQVVENPILPCSAGDRIASPTGAYNELYDIICSLGGDYNRMHIPATFSYGPYNPVQHLASPITTN